MGQVCFAASSFCVAFVLGACGDDITREVVETVAGEALFESSAEPAGDNCAEGGTALSVGLDRDGDGALSADEIDSTSYLCDAASGATAGSTVVTADEPAGQNCPFGGVAITTGVDADGDGALSGDEVVDVVYICTPELTSTRDEPALRCRWLASTPALTPTGTDSSAPTSTRDEPAGENRAAGGLRIDAGVDADGDGQTSAPTLGATRRAALQRRSETTYACVRVPDNTTGRSPAERRDLRGEGEATDLLSAYGGKRPMSLCPSASASTRTRTACCRKKSRASRSSSATPLPHSERRAS